MSPAIRDIEPISDHRYLVAESPVWDDRRHCAFFVDVKGHLLGAYVPETGTITHWRVPEDIGFVALTSGDDLILGLKSGLCRFDPEREVFEPMAVIAPLDDERLNDGKVAPDGALWFGVMALDARAGRGRLYRYNGGDTTELVDAGYAVPNGPAFGREGQVLHCDTLNNHILSLHADPGGWTRQRYLDVPSGWGHPDGLEFDLQGRVWCGLWGGAGLLVAEGGDVPELQRLPVPATWVTSLTPIGTRGDQLLITSARAPLMRGEVQREPHDGAVFTAQIDQEWVARSMRLGDA